MSKKIPITLCSLALAMVMATGCNTSNSEPDYTNVIGTMTATELLPLTQFAETPASEETDPAIVDPVVVDPTISQSAQRDAHRILMQEIRDRYNALAVALIEATNLQIAAVYEQTLGDEYIKLRDEYASIETQYSTLVQGFYADSNYLALKDSINAKLVELSALTRGTTEYNDKIQEINAIWGQISTLAGEVNSQLSTLNTQARQITTDARALIASKADELEQATAPIMTQYALDIAALNDAFMSELSILQQTLGLNTNQCPTQPNHRPNPGQRGNRR